METEKYIEKWLNGSLSEEEERVFKNTEDYQSLQKLDKALLRFKAPDYDVQGELARLNEQKNLGGKIIRVSWMAPLIRVAAIVIMVLLGYLMFFQDAVTSIETEIAQKTELSLPDQSAVVLNAASTITYIEKQWDKQRQVKLTGEAYFKVAKGARFEVETTAGIVSVLGTQFNVKVRDNYFEVICYEGLVAVKSGQKSVELPANHSFRIINKKVSTENKLIESAPSWLNHESSFTSVPYEQVIREFERQYNVFITTIKVDLNQLFSGRFTHNDISLALKSISLPLNLRYEITKDEHIVLTSDIE